MILKFSYKNSVCTKRFGHGCGYLSLLLLIFVFSGCCFLNQPGKMHPETIRLKAGETAFFQEEYNRAGALFSETAEKSQNPRIQNIALYNLACTKLALSDNEDEFIEAMELLDNWQPLKPEKTNFENPLLVIQLLQNLTQLNRQERLEYIKTNKAMKAVVKHQNNQINELKKMIKILQYQISELENIDQEIQEKRKTN